MDERAAGLYRKALTASDSRSWYRKSRLSDTERLLLLLLLSGSADQLEEIVTDVDLSGLERQNLAVLI